MCNETKYLFIRQLILRGALLHMKVYGGIAAGVRGMRDRTDGVIIEIRVIAKNIQHTIIS